MNYHHLRYFREVANEGNLSRAAARLNVSQSALSIQIRQLEERFGNPLFDRSGRQLVLTEAGRIALDHAERIFATGEELVATLTGGRRPGEPVRIGALSTLSRNFQIAFLRPVLGRADAPVILRSGDNDSLLAALKALALDLVLTTAAPDAADGSFAAQRLDEQEAGLHGHAHRLSHRTAEELLASEPLIVPASGAVRSGLEALLSRLGVHPRLAAEVDDMAMIRLLAREDAGVAVAPAVVFRDELESGELASAPFRLGIAEPFYAVTVKRLFPHPLAGELVSAAMRKGG